jgi:hypothetical protein
VELAAKQRGKAFRRELLAVWGDGELPPPTAVPLALVLRNTGARPLVVQVGDAATDLALEVRGRGVIRLRAPGVAGPESLQLRTLRLAPGEQGVFRIERLIAGAPGRWEYLYLTEPGDYVLTARLRLTAGGRVTTLTSEPIHIRVGG